VIFITLLQNRRAATAVPVFLEESRSETPAVRNAAMTALRQLAEPEHVPALLQILLKTTKGGERDEAERIILQVSMKVPEPAKQAEPVLEAYGKASVEDKIKLLPLLGRFGGPKILDQVKLASPIRALKPRCRRRRPVQLARPDRLRPARQDDRGDQEPRRAVPGPAQPGSESTRCKAKPRLRRVLK